MDAFVKEYSWGNMVMDYVYGIPMGIDESTGEVYKPTEEEKKNVQMFVDAVREKKKDVKIQIGFFLATCEDDDEEDDLECIWLDENEEDDDEDDE